MKTFDGSVIKTAMQKTATVEVVRTAFHPLYKVRMTKSKKYKCDTGELTVAVGEKVRIAETRPISKDKHFKIIKVLSSKKEKTV